MSLRQSLIIDCVGRTALGGMGPSYIKKEVIYSIRELGIKCHKSQRRELAAHWQW